METIKVNMSPNPLDVQTIHASQNDNEAREWGFELHNNGDAIDSSSISDQLVFKAYKGGTEQILPENTSTPTTSPFKGDIKYPQGLLSDQEFLYRESPTEEDGNAKIKNLYGNTLVWNQLVPLAISRTHNGLTWSIDSDGLISVSGTATSSFSAVILTDYLRLDSSHKYALISSGNELGTPRFSLSSFDSGNINESSSRFNAIAQFANTGGSAQIRFVGLSIGQTYNEKRYLRVHDLTQMFGSGNEPSTVEEFTSLFPLPYYAYNQGTLLSFMGNGIKTVSKNQFDTQVATTSYAGLVLTKTQGTIRALYSGGSQYAGFNFYGSPVFTDTFLKGKYRLSFDVKGLDTQWTVGLRQGASFLGGGQALAISNDGHYSFTIDAEANPNCYLSFARTGNKTTAYDVTFSNIQLELGTTETSYEPYISSTLSLPISTYFPSGMKSTGSVHDELTESKAITRIGAVDLGTLDYTYTEGSQQFRSTTALQNAKLVSDSSGVPNAKSALYDVVNYATMINSDMALAIVFSGSFAQGQVWIKNSNYTNVTAFKTAMSGVFLYYELATPTETSFTTASLVTENAEIPLSNEDGVLIGKCTEQLSSESGFFDAKIKLADEDGECYSNKIQLHVERSPQ